MAKKQAACSTEGIPADVLAVYKRKKTNASRLKYIEVQLDPRTPKTAANRHAQLLVQINNAFPGYIDIEEMVEQTSFFTKKDVGGTAKVRADVSRGSDPATWLTVEADDKAAAAVVATVEKVSETKRQARRPKRSSKKVVGGEQTGNSESATKGNPITRTLAKKGAGQQVTDPKAKEGNQPDGPAKSKQTERKVEQPTALEQQAADKRIADRAKTKAQVAREKEGMAGELEATLEQLMTTTGAAWKDAVYTILDMALLQTRSGLSAEQIIAHEEALDMVNGLGPNAELLWGKVHKMDTLKVFIDMLADTVLSKDGAQVSDPTFNKHIKMWELARDHNIFPAALKAVTRPKQKIVPVNPTKPEDWMIELVPSLGDVNRKATVTQEEVVEIVSETAKEYESIEFEELEEQTQQEALDGADISDSMINSYYTDMDFDGRGKVFDDNHKPITKPISLGNAKLWTGVIMGKLNKAATFKWRVYKNVAEMKRKDPDLYARAVASRPDKKDIPENAAGYAYADRISIFSDNIATRKQLAFTIAHEAIGHFGLGSIMPEKNFTKLLDDIYAIDRTIQMQADLLVEMRGLDKHEAIEEVLADRAADLHVNIVRRIYDAIKNFLNRLGVEFTDDLTRYFVHHSRRYQRTGQTPDASPYAVLREFKRFDGLQGRAREHTTFHDVNEPTSRTEGGGYHGMPNRIKSALRNATSLSTIGGAAKRGLKIIARIIENIQSLDNLSLRSRPLQEIFEILTMEKQHLETLKTRIGEITAWSHSSWGQDVPTGEEKAFASLVMPWYNRSRADRVTPTDLKNAPDLAVEKGGKWVRNKAGWDASRRAGHMSMEEINKGFEFQKIDNAGRPAVERRGDDSIIYYEGGKEVPNAAKVEDQRGQPKKIMETKKLVAQNGKAFTVDKRVYRIIEEQRLATDTIAEAVYLDKLNGMRADHEASYKAMQDRFKGIEDREIKAIREVFAVYQKLYNEGATLEGAGMKWKQSSKDRARYFVHHAMRLLDGKGAKDKRSDWVNGPPAQVVDKNGDRVTNRDVKAMADFLQGGSHHALTNSVVQDLLVLSKDKVGRGIIASKISTELQNMFLLETQITNAELYAKNTIQTAYIPLKRRGRYQVRVVAFAVGDDGKLSRDVVNLPDNMQAQLYYTRMDSQQAAEEKTKELSEILNGSDFVKVVLEGGDEVTVGFRSMWNVAPQGSSLSGSINYDDLASVLVRAGVNISPQDREKLVQLTASEHSTARSNLQKDWTPGWDPNILQGIAEHLEQQAHIAAKNLMQHRINRLMTDAIRKGDWLGDRRKLIDLQDAFLIAKKTNNASSIHEAYRELAAYQWQYISSAPTEAEAYIKMYTEDGSFKLVNGHSKGEQYRAKANTVIAGYNKQQGTPATGEEMLGEQGSWAMSGTAALQLGGSLAPAIVNMMSLVTHAAPYLATFNPKTGYGGGHGLQAAYMALQKAGSDLSLIKILTQDRGKDVTGNAKALNDIAARLRKKPAGTREHGLLLDEAEMLAELTAEGVLTPNMFNQLSDVARTGKAGSKIGKVVDVWMLPFSKTEQYNRRVTALASYRLDKARMQEAGNKKTLTSGQKEELHNRATQAVNYSQGNYDSFNRPAWAQGSVFKYLWMYKQFQVITVQLMRNMALKERLAMVGLLVLMSGLKGIPFADDLADLVDTLMQKFGLKWTGLEAELSLALDAGGISSAFVTRGALDYWFGFTASTRLGMGDLIPGTGYFKAGSDHERELQSIFGPVYGAWFGSSGVVSSASTSLQYIAEVVGLKDDVTSLGDVLRTGGGSSALKNYAKGFTLLIDGSVTNARGQMVAKDAGVFAAITQLMGFYPAAATDQYAVIRMTNDARDYAQAIKTGYIDAWIKADSAQERSAVRAMVNDWNKGASGTIFHIRNFVLSANKAKKSAQLTSSERNLKTVPTAGKQFGKDLMKARGLSATGIPLG